MPLAFRFLFSAFRLCFAILGLQLLALGGASAADLSFVRVWPHWYDDDALTRISEYFTGREAMGDRIFVRSHPEIRSGLYFIVRVRNPGSLVSGTKFVLHVILPVVPDPRVFTFPADVPAGGKVYQLGLTGADWPGKKAYPVAWRLELLGPDGRLLAAQESFLWSKPE